MSGAGKSPASWRRGGLLSLALSLVAACQEDPNAVTSGALTIRGAFAPAPVVAGDAANAVMSAYFVVDNDGDADTLDAVIAPAAAKAAVHTDVREGGMQVMRPAEHLEVPASGTLVLAPGTRHVMLEQLAGPPRAGDTLTLTARFRHAGDVGFRVPVIPYMSLDSAIAARKPLPRKPLL